MSFSIGGISLTESSPFHVLNNAQVQEQFDSSLMGLLEHATYRVFTVVIDKREHAVRYKRTSI
jgi:hypothetical protein